MITLFLSQGNFCATAFVLYYYKTYPTFDVLGAQFAMARSKANENLHKLSPILYDTLVHLELMPYRELATPEALKAALHGVDRLESMEMLGETKKIN